MKHLSIVLVLFVLISSCNSKETDTTKVSDKKIEYDMYEPSEMSLLMNEMYDMNMQIKQDILDGKVPDTFPEDFLKIHTAVMSDFKSRNERFESFSKLFILSEREVFNTESKLNLTTRYNNAINVCVSCHQTECTGPIPRIKKLLIK